MNVVDKRGTMESIPDGIKRLLSVDQVIALRQLESFGWRIQFIRRPLFQKIIVALTSYDGKEFGILEADGQLNMHPDIKLREQVSKSQKASPCIGGKITPGLT